MLKRTGPIALLSLGLVLAALPTARADFKVYTETHYDDIPPIPLTPTDWGPSTPALMGTNPFQLQLFDPNKHVDANGVRATLRAVEFKLNATFTNQISMRFDTSSFSSVNASGEMHIFGVGGRELVIAPSFTTWQSDIVTVFPQSGSVMKNFKPTVHNSVGDVTYYLRTHPGMIAQYTGSGFVSLPVYAFARSNYYNSSGNGEGISHTLAAASISVVYYYSFIVPEPSSLALTGLGAVGLLAACRGRLRRKDQAAG